MTISSEVETVMTHVAQGSVKRTGITQLSKRLAPGTRRVQGR
jgi:hypothetical protein